MNWSSVPCLAMAAITLYVGSYHFATYLKRRQSITHLPFALLCVCVGAYDMLCVGLYNSTSLAEGVGWQRLQLGAIACISVCVAWFVGLVTGSHRPRFLLLLAGWYGLLVVLSFFLSPSATLDLARPSIKHVQLLGFPAVTYYEAQLGPIFSVVVLTSVLTYVYVVRLLLRLHFRQADASTLGMVFSQAVYFAGVFNDAMVAGGGYRFLYLSEYAFLVIVLAMAHRLLSEFVEVHTKLEAMNGNLEAVVRERTLEIRQLNEDLTRLVDTDPLTGAYNRRFLDRYLEIETRRVESSLAYDTGAHPDTALDFGLAIIDLDNFKRINDRLGHAAGDLALVQFAETVRSAMFSRDVFCRYGGEEFVVIFTQTTPLGVLQAAEKLRQSVDARIFQLTGPQSEHRLTVSIGVSFFGERPELSGHEMVRLADERLLLAKRRGKNCVVAKTDADTASLLPESYAARSASWLPSRRSAPSIPG